MLEINVGKDGWTKQTVEVPFLPYDEVFHENIVCNDIPLEE